MTEQQAKPGVALVQTDMTQQSWPSVDIVVLNWNGKRLLVDHLPALLVLDYPRFRIVVVDNHSTDGSVTFVRENFPQVDLIVHNENLGFGPALNAAVAQLSADIIVLLNNDVKVRSDWLKELITGLRSDANIGVAGCKLLFPDEKTIQHAGANLSYPLAYSQHHKYQQTDDAVQTKPVDVSYVTGAAMAIPRQIIDELGLFTPELAPFYYEEVDFCYRASDAGYRVVYIPTAVAIHHESHSFQQINAQRLFYFHKNRLRFILKHYTLAQFFDDFVPAELEQLQRPQGSNSLLQLRRAYLANRLILPDVIDPLVEPALLDRYARAFNRLRDTAVAQQPKIETRDPENPLAAELKQKEALSEFTFPAQSAGLGGLISTARRAWYSVAAKWAVRALAQQQTLFNRLISRLLSDQERLNTATAAEISLLADRLTARDRQDATVDMQTELDALKARVAQLEAALGTDTPAEIDSPK